MVQIRPKMMIMILMTLQTRLGKLRRLEMDVGASVGTGVVIISILNIIITSIILVLNISRSNKSI